MSDRLTKLQKILAAEPNDAFALYGAAQEYAKLGDAASAVSHYDRCLAADPSYTYAFYHKARVQADSGDTPSAIATIKSGMASAKQSRDEKALNELAALLDSLT